jgi:hypothetical protein
MPQTDKDEIIQQLETEIMGKDREIRQLRRWLKKAEDKLNSEQEPAIRSNPAPANKTIN